MIRFATKRFIPDFSPSLQELSVEIKFPTKTRKLTAILNEIAASRMAHVATGRSLLFVIYDYHHMITNDDEIEQDVSKHDAPHVFLTIVR